VARTINEDRSKKKPYERGKKGPALRGGRSRLKISPQQKERWAQIGEGEKDNYRKGERTNHQGHAPDFISEGGKKGGKDEGATVFLQRGKKRDKSNRRKEPTIPPKEQKEEKKTVALNHIKKRLEGPKQPLSREFRRIH